MMITDLSFIRLSSALISVLSLVALAGTIFGEAELGEDVGDPDFGAVCLLARSNFQRMLEHLGDACVLPLAEPFRDRAFPDVFLETQGLFGGSERLQSRRLQPPLRTRLESRDGLGPELAAVALESLAVNHTMARDRPNAPRAGRVFQITASDGVDGARKHALPRHTDGVFAVGWTETVGPPRQKCFDGRRRGLGQCIQLRDLYQQHSGHFLRRILAGDVAEAVGKPAVPDSQGPKCFRLLFPLRALEDQHVVDLAPGLVDASNCRDQKTRANRTCVFSIVGV